jgi:hypothetical protein
MTGIDAPPNLAVHHRIAGFKPPATSTGTAALVSSSLPRHESRRALAPAERGIQSPRHA